MKIILEGNPISTSHIYLRSRNKGMFMTPQGRALKESYQWQAKSQFKQKVPIKGNLRINIYLYFKDKRKRDWDNWHKLSMDSLNGIVWEDDCQVQDSRVRKFIDKDNPRIEIEISVLPLD